ncbi:MAG: dTDP-4-dehydrorhamnose 3,5-epimerase [Crenarchaeota archaeon]|nr:MAG: dTDP-4-dehydrorhamnose 3,5-epimerase [Thermoproteota archaeon]RDJ33341.1 MAG: dTDP-4-dehydrorhamnose 3,5-epimerase [Thermoproteota archaeon]RDJ36156.1 MAG: dTDP-4-dehydrorhamnose 3,5-epimerase [Thermoproteota archaeon]RDJ38788.1 MAG: dTDP-4-dehydrorhamnose 3,5-epimerase [Thermoproteota archaeon]
MIISKTEFIGVYVIDTEKIVDERGFFSRIWDEKKFKDKQLNTNWIQSSISYNKASGTIRGMHFQNEPYQEIKMVRCVSGSIFDVIIDLRISSSTYLQSFSIELNEENQKAIYIPKGFAHGFQTLQNDTVVLYNISEYYNPEYAKGIRWNDPIINVKWPLNPSVISEKDKMYKNFLK